MGMMNLKCLNPKCGHTWRSDSVKCPKCGSYNTTKA